MHREAGMCLSFPLSTLQHSAFRARTWVLSWTHGSWARNVLSSISELAGVSFAINLPRSTWPTVEQDPSIRPLIANLSREANEHRASTMIPRAPASMSAVYLVFQIERWRLPESLKDIECLSTDEKRNPLLWTQSGCHDPARTEMQSDTGCVKTSWGNRTLRPGNQVSLKESI